MSDARQTTVWVDRAHQSDTSDMLLYSVAGVQVEPVGELGWFRRRRNALAVVVSREEDVSDILLRLPEHWNIVDRARCRGLHDEPDIVSADPRFKYGFVDASCAIVAHDDGLHFALLMQINAAEAALLPHRPFRDRASFEQCIGAAEDSDSLSH